jgi:hypothetical protein
MSIEPGDQDEGRIRIANFRRAALRLCQQQPAAIESDHGGRTTELRNHDGGGTAGLGNRALPRRDAAALLLIGSGSGHSIKLSDPIPC